MQKIFFSTVLVRQPETFYRQVYQDTEKAEPMQCLVLLER